MRTTRVLALTLMLLFSSCLCLKKYVLALDRANLFEARLSISQSEVAVLKNNLANKKKNAK